VVAGWGIQSAVLLLDCVHARTPIAPCSGAQTTCGAEKLLGSMDSSRTSKEERDYNSGKEA